VAPTFGHIEREVLPELCDSGARYCKRCRSALLDGKPRGHCVDCVELNRQAVFDHIAKNDPIISKAIEDRIGEVTDSHEVECASWYPGGDCSCHAEDGR
jgi:hypothetical protein